MQFKIYSIDSGFARINYVTKNEAGQRLFYCLQDGGRFLGIQLFRCGQDGEPSHEVKLKIPLSQVFQIPKGDSDLELKCKQYIESQV